MSKSIGNGVQFLNRHLSSKLFQDKESLYPLLNFLKVHSYKGTVSFQYSGSAFVTHLVAIFLMPWQLGIRKCC
jgi:hypothetical protein